MPGNTFDMRIGFAARYDPRDKRTWSGTAYYTYQQLCKYGEVLIYQYDLPKLLQEWLTTRKSINRKFFKKKTAVEFLVSYAKHFSKKLTKDLRKRPVDILFVSASPQLIAYVETDIPIVYMTDATFQQLQGYYESFSNLSVANIREGIHLDKKAFQKAAHCMLASDWCRDAALQDYGIAAEKISVVPCGANLDQVPPAMYAATDPNKTCQLLFLGVEWSRKGGDLALETFRLLKQKGIPVSMHIIGSVPPVPVDPTEGITVIPFLDKNKPEDFQELESVFRQTDFLLLPTRAECAGIVFCEAAAYGIPSISTDTGGVRSYVREGLNGYLLPVSAGASEYTRVIAALWEDATRLQELKKSSRILFEKELNWDAWGLGFQRIASRLCAK